MYSASPQCRLRKCSKCSGNTAYFCQSCSCDLCKTCKKSHVYDLKTIDHNVVIYPERFIYIPKQEICLKHSSNVCTKYCQSCEVPVCGSCSEHKACGLKACLCIGKHDIVSLKKTYSAKQHELKETIDIIKIRTLFYKRVLIARINDDFKTCYTEVSLRRSETLTKAKKLKHYLDNVTYYLSKDILFNHLFLITKYLECIQRYEHSYEHSTIEPVQFLSFIKTHGFPNIQENPTFSLQRQFTMPESINRDDVMKSLSKIQVKRRGKRCIKLERQLKLLSDIVLHKRFIVTDVESCCHISCVTLDKVWVSDDKHNVTSINRVGKTLNHSKKLCRNYGSHTVNSMNEFIYIDRNHKIIKLSKDMRKPSILIHGTIHQWKPRSVFCCSRSTGDLLVGLCKGDRGKVARYKHTGELKDTIKYSSTGQEIYKCPNYIIENNNEDVVVSDFSAVVVTDRGGRLRFVYTGYPSDSQLKPHGICTDALSHILVCDETSRTIQMINEDGTFQSRLLIGTSGIFFPRSLSYDVLTHHLLVGSNNNKEISVYQFMTRSYPMSGK